MAESTAPDPVKRAIAPKRTRHYRAVVFQGYVALAALAFTVLFGLVIGVPYFTVDVTVTRAVQEFSPAWFSVLMEIISFPGSSPQSFVLVALVVLLLFALGLRWESIAALIAAAGSALVDTVAKVIVHRARPPGDIVHVFATVQGYSFPSGHVVFYTAFFGFLIFLAFVLLKRNVWRTATIAVLSFFIATVGLSRIYLGAHWLSDVVGAYLLGSIWLAVAIFVYQWGKPRFFVRQPAAPEKPAQPEVPAARERSTRREAPSAPLRRR